MYLALCLTLSFWLLCPSERHELAFEKFIFSHLTQLISGRRLLIWMVIVKCIVLAKVHQNRYLHYFLSGFHVENDFDYSSSFVAYLSSAIMYQILNLAHNRSDIERRVHAVIAKFAERGLRSLAVAFQASDSIVSHHHHSFSFFLPFLFFPFMLLWYHYHHYFLFYFVLLWYHQHHRHHFLSFMLLWCF